MDYTVAITFIDNVVHRLKCGEDITVAQRHLGDISEAVGGKYEFRNDAGRLIYVCNLDNFLFAFIEETSIKEVQGEPE
jgi:hypothetical protein